MTRWLAVLAALTLVATGVGMFWWVRGSSGSALGSAPPYTHMHCPECFLELPYNAVNSFKPCPHCGSSGPKMVPTVGRRGEELTGGVGVVGRWLAGATITLVVVQAGLYAWLVYARWRRVAAEEASKQPLVCRCPFCNRKIGYPPNKVGAGTICPRCKTSFMLPAVGIALQQ
jgi:Zn finger protein HypA/HybF involved in hydrogenase expression